MSIDEARRKDIKEKTVFLSGVIKELQAEYGKQVLSLSSGVLALSAAFIKNITDVASATYVGLVYFAWIDLLLAIILTLLAMRISADANKKYKAGLDAVLEQDEEYDIPIGWG